MSKVSKVWDWNLTFVKVSCETNSLLFSWKSDIDENGSFSYHTTHKNYQNLLQNIGDSDTATYPALRGDYGLHNRPTAQAIGKIVKKFEEKCLQILKGLGIDVSLVPLKILPL